MLKLPKEFQDAVDAKLVSCRKHPTDDLWILNYTPECQFSKSWNEITLQCRGLIVNANGKVVARPFKKFFNLSEHDNPNMEKVPFGSPFKAYEKVDGSMGIAYASSGGWEIATRGSFESDQANFASALLYSPKYSGCLPYMQRDLAYLFEIVYPQNRIVCDYGKTQELVLLGVIRTADGEEIPLEKFKHLPFRQPQIFEVSDIESLPRDTQNFEGYVIRFDNGLRVKVKLDDYVRLHKLMTGITANRLWEMLKSGQDIDAAIKELPDEMYDEVIDTVNEIRNEHVAFIDMHIMTLELLDVQNLSRKEQASIIIQKCKAGLEVDGLVVSLNAGVMFMLLDGQKEKVKAECWKFVKPKDGNKLICKADLAG